MQFIVNLLYSQVAGGHLKKDQVKKFPDVMDDFLTTFAYRKTERENRVNQGLDLREKDLLDEQNKQEEEVYKKVGTLYLFSLQLSSQQGILV